MILDKPIKSKCTRCPHMGRTRNPDYYLCGACYGLVMSYSAKKKAAKLRVRANKLIAESLDYAAKTRKFQEKHPGTGRLPAHFEEEAEP